jgi:predicted dehydrogenase
VVPTPVNARPTEDAVRVALVGAGSVARRHAGVLSDLGASVVAVADPDERVARELAARHGAPVFATAEHALDAVEVDAVYICVPHFAHGDPERAALGRGLPLFVEKPLAADLGTAEELAREVVAAGVPTGTGYHWRCLDVLPRALELLDGQEAVLATGAWVGARPPVAWWSRRDLGGGQVIEQLTHLLDLARFLLGPADAVHASSVRRTADEDGVEDATAATVRFRSGAVATFATSCVLDAPHEAALRVVAPRVAMTVTEDGLTVQGPGGTTTQPVAEDPRIAVDRDFLDFVRGRRSAAIAPYADVLESHRLACAIEHSARTGESITLDRPPGGDR